MNVGEAISYLWELAGEPSDLDPWGTTETVYDPNQGTLLPNSFGYRYFIKQINKAQMTLANYRTRKGRPIRFKKFLTRKNVKLGLTDPVSSGVTLIDTFTIRITDPPSTDVDDYVDTKINLIRTDGADESDTQDFMVVLAQVISPGSIDFTFQDEIVVPTFGIVTTTAEFYFSAFKLKRQALAGTGFSINLPTYTRNITAIWSMATGLQLKRAEAKTRLYDYTMQEGTPVQWYKSGETIYFDTYIGDPIWWTFDYQRLPLDVSLYDDEFDIPEHWQDVILMLVEQEAARRAIETEKVAVLGGQIQNLISQLRTDEEEDWLGEETGGFYVRKEART